MSSWSTGRLVDLSAVPDPVGKGLGLLTTHSDKMLSLLLPKSDG